MKLRIFQSDKGDCLLHESDGKFVLCDGGMSSSMKEFVRDELGALRKAGFELEAVYVSHIDSDHISGVLTMLEDELTWRVFDHHRGDGAFHEPKVPRPPEIKRIWHNAFRDQLGKNAGAVTSLLAAAAPALIASTRTDWVRAGLAMRNIAVSIPEALKVSGLASPELLDIPVNEIPGAPAGASRKLMMIREDQKPFRIGACKWTIVGPTEDEISSLRKGWNNWLADNEEAVEKIRKQIRDRVDKFSSGVLADSPFDLGGWNGVPNFKGVTIPNIASLMFMVEEGGKRLLLTGDSQQLIILKGLEQTGFLEEDGGLHVTALKVQHHGSEHNLDEAFARRVSADHYIFCGNGEHGNPDPRVIQRIFDSRLGPDAKRALAPEAAGRPFRFWFSTSSKVLKEGSKERKAFEDREALVASLVKQSGGKLRASFNTKASITLAL